MKTITYGRAILLVVCKGLNRSPWDLSMLLLELLHWCGSSTQGGEYQCCSLPAHPLSHH